MYNRVVLKWYYHIKVLCDLLLCALSSRRRRGSEAVDSSTPFATDANRRALTKLFTPSRPSWRASAGPWRSSRRASCPPSWRPSRCLSPRTTRASCPASSRAAPARRARPSRCTAGTETRVVKDETRRRFFAAQKCTISRLNTMLHISFICGVYHGCLIFSGTFFDRARCRGTVHCWYTCVELVTTNVSINRAPFAFQRFSTRDVTLRTRERRPRGI